jgi:hypothetical protein
MLVAHSPQVLGWTRVTRGRGRTGQWGTASVVPYAPPGLLVGFLVGFFDGF